MDGHTDEQCENSISHHKFYEGLGGTCGKKIRNINSDPVIWSDQEVWSDQVIV